LLSKNFVIGFKGANMIIPLNKLLLKLDHGKRAIFNIKKSVNQYAVLGEPIFQHYFMAFDYLYNRVGFSGKREVEDYFIFDITTLIRFLCCVMVFGKIFDKFRLLCYLLLWADFEAEQESRKGQEIIQDPEKKGEIGSRKGRSEQQRI